MIVEDGVKPRDAALVFNVKPTMVWSLMRKVKTEELAVDSIRQRQEARKAKRAEAAEVVATKLKEG